MYCPTNPFSIVPILIYETLEGVCRLCQVQKQYLLIVPSVLQSGTSNEACVDLQDLNETVSLNVELKYGLDSHKLWEGSVNQSQFSQCFAFQVPPAQSNHLAFIEISVKGRSLNFHERRSVAIRNISTATFIQTDKPIYQPNQKVMFRVLTLDINFIPVKEMYPLIYIEDPQGNRIAQWLNQSSDSGILQLELPIAQGAPLGMYRIVVQGTRDDANSPYEINSSTSTFTLKEYVLPKYEVKINAPQRVSPYDEEFTVEVCADYTYGQPVQGTVQLRVKLTDENEKPLANGLILLTLNGEVVGNLTTDKDGIAPFSIRTSNLFDPRYKLVATMTSYPGECIENNWPEADDIKSTHHIQRFYSRTGSYLEIEPVSEELKCGQTKPINVRYILNGAQDTAGRSAEVYFYYILMNRGKIVGSGKQKVSISVGRDGSFAIPIEINMSLAPRPSLVVYTIYNELVADSTFLQVEKCFRNKVSLQFSEKQALPGSTVSLEVKAASNSICALRAVDKSVLLQSYDSSLTPDSVYYRFPYLELYGYYYNGLNLDDYPELPCIEPKDTFFNGMFYIPVNVTNDGTVYDIFKNLGLKVFTNSTLQKPVVCQSDWECKRKSTDEMDEAPASGFGGASEARKGIIETVRSFFPETWIWKLQTVGLVEQIRATLQDSPDFKVKSSPQDNNYAKICANERKTYTWTIAPNKLGPVNISVTSEAKATELTQGRRDTIIKPLLVEPEGIKKELAQSVLISANGTTVIESIALSLPANVVQGSADAYLFVLGDILGTAMRNTESFLRIPDGCGEQTIAMFGSNLIVLDYLNKTGQLTEEKKSRIVGHLISGYQKQLSFRLYDGSFSTFGSRDAVGNVWLTALVYRTFGQAKQQSIYIDENILSQALIWIASKQESDGSFPSEGQIFNNVLKFPVVKNGLAYLDAASEKGVISTYEKALLAHTYGLAGNREKQKQILEDLKRSAVRTGNLVHWEREKKPGAETHPSFYSRAPSAEIELTAYVALAMLDQHNLSQTDRTFIYQTISWLVKQQNPYGGFSSTQDTLVALQALSEYGVISFVKNAQNTVKVSSGESFSRVFQVNRDNSVLLQQAVLPNIPGNYSVEVNGFGNVYVQVFLQYNIILPTVNSGFDLTLQTRNASCTGNHLPKFDLVLTARYTGERNTSNMVIIDVKMLSGHVPVQASLDKVPKKPVTLEITLEQTFPVANSKPAQVMIYDYYETDEDICVFFQQEFNDPHT
ncbi:hypothetical protein lerEdw1_020563 [Lerista edwardsae]|nr:hypothetical protein lerEdw1_020563 [Lerista edwardsae]